MRKKYLFFIVILSFFLIKTKKDPIIRLNKELFLNNRENIEKYFKESSGVNNYVLKDPNYYYMFARYLTEKYGYSVSSDFLYKRAITSNSIFKDDAFSFFFRLYISDKSWDKLKSFVNMHKKHFNEGSYQIFTAFAEDKKINEVDDLGSESAYLPVICELAKKSGTLMIDPINKAKIDNYIIKSKLYNSKDKKIISNIFEIYKTTKNDYFLYTIYCYARNDRKSFIYSLEKTIKDYYSLTNEKMDILKKFSISLGLRKNFYGILSRYYMKNKTLSYYYAFEILNFENYGKYSGFLKKLPVTGEISPLNHEIRYKNLYYTVNYTKKWMNEFVSFYNDYPGLYKSNILLYNIFRRGITTGNGRYYAEYLEKINTEDLNPVNKYHFYYYLYLLDKGNEKWKTILNEKFPLAYPALNMNNGRIEFKDEKSAKAGFLPKKHEMSVDALLKLAKINYLLEFGHYNDALNIETSELKDNEKAVLLYEFYKYNIENKDYYTALRYSNQIAELIYPEGIFSAENIECLKMIYPMHYKDHIFKYCREFNIDPAMALAVMREESCFSHKIVSYQNAIGLMQIIPPTGKFIANKLRLKNYNLYNPDDNIKMGVYYLNFLKKYFKENELILSCYNAGQGKTINWHKALNKYPEAVFYEMIPIHETRYYIKKVMNSYYVYKFLIEQEAGNLASKTKTKSSSEKN